MSLAEDNERLKRELTEIAARSKQEKAQYEQQMVKERAMAKAYTEQVQQKTSELENVRGQMVRLTRQLDDEVQRRDQTEVDTQALERRLHEIEGGGSAPAPAASRRASQNSQSDANEMGRETAKVSTKLMRVVDQWMQTKDLQQALLRGAGVNDTSFMTLVNVLSDCKSLQVLDLSHNQLTMDSCSDLCRLITTSPSLSFMGIADNLFSMRSIGYFMTAVMERQNKKKLAPLEVLDMSGNEGFLRAMESSPPDYLLKQVHLAPDCSRLPYKGDVLVAQVMRELWRFLHYTEHPQVVNTKQDEVSFAVVDKMTIRKMEVALCKIMLMSEETGDGPKVLHANMALVAARADDHHDEMDKFMSSVGSAEASKPGKQTVVTNEAGRGGGYGAERPASGGKKASASGPSGTGGKAEPHQPPPRTELRDPFSDLKAAFEPPKEKLKTFNLKQIVTRNDTVLMNMLERLLETTEIDARDVETEQTLLEYACMKGNMGLAKLCYRRGANLSAKTKKGYTYFAIVTKAKRYDLMEFLHSYGVKINHQDQFGTTPLHIAAANDDVDGICRLVEWGADVNLFDFRKRTPLHTAARKGNAKAAMLLLELGADMNFKDEKQYTAVAHAEEKNHFALMDRLVLLGGKGNGLQSKMADLKTKSGKPLGQVTVTASMLKSSSLGRIGKISVNGLPGQIRPFQLKG